MIRALRAIGIGLAAIIAVGCGVVLIVGPAPLRKAAMVLGVAPPDATVAGVSIGGPFTLTDASTGATVTDASYRGRWMLVYFGYTFCPDICPTDLQKMVAALAGIGAAADRITPIFITVDPSRDSVLALARYVALFSPKLVGLTGSQTQIDTVARGYRVYVEKVPPTSPGGAYFVNHSAFMYLMDPAGRLAAIFPPDIKAADLGRKLAAATAGPPAS